ncbi:ubiquinol-cytochrome c reductase core subunit 1 [Entomophthora muscae]|uniref:Ubiquinol-cytochrome c reductase core subunit 1 n=1 Tax=Entomophthora muscae TaxID=34485 RepID=A0ACC2ST40_9FUNG|nr:ubiquinol-cytochrome c reductase core subunit 1 [Entomophthora muscae]
MIRAVRSAKVLGQSQRAGFASVATSAPSSSSVSKLDNGIKIATQGNNAPIATLCVVAQAGSRFESKLGSSHFLKNFAFKNTTKRTGFRLTRESELQGASLAALSTRESIIYSAQFFREDAPYFVEAFSDFLQNSKYADHEADEVSQLVALESSLAPIETHVLNGLHREAFRTGLGNSTLAQNGVSTKDIREYAARALAPNRLTFFGFNVDASALNTLKSSFTSTSSSLKTEASKYYGGETRTSADAPVGHVAIGFEGASLGSDKEATLTVLRHILGGQSHLKWGSGASPVAKLVAGTSAQASAFNFSYSDAGLFGLYIAAPSAEITQLANSSLAELRKTASGLSAEELKRGIALARFEALSSLESQYSKAVVFGTQVSLSGKMTEDAASRFSSVTENQVVEAAKKLLSGKPTVSTYGNLQSLPYADQLKF